MSALELRHCDGKQRSIDETPASHSKVDLTLDTVIVNSDIIQNFG